MRKLSIWLGPAIILFIIFGTIYVVVQQAQRRDANYPQIQLAEDTALSLDQGTKPATLTTGNIDINISLAPFIEIYDKSGRALAGSGYLDGSLPAVPYGILTAANGKTYHMITWEPKSGIRIAAISVADQGYYVLSGRSLTEVEKNETATLQLSALGGLASLLVLAATYWVSEKAPKNNLA